MSAPDEVTLRTCPDIGEIDAEQWDACARPGPDVADNPFLRHAFLHALEASGSAVSARGWQPLHLLLEGSDGELLGAVPLYVKGHSRGEYVFDHAWADALHRAGGQYYPKLQASVPFTPATGRRLLAGGSGEERARRERLLARGSAEVAAQLGVSSLHYTFLPEEQWRLLGEHGLLLRMDQQFHWQNAGYADFESFLGELSSKKRKTLRRERREALAEGIEIEWITGSDLAERHWDAFHEFYMDTGARKWGSPYLTREFFSRIGESMPEQTLLILARRGGRYIAGALNFIGSDTLFGRNWGCIEDHRFLHFEVCYYQAIDFAIAHGLQVVEAGAQGAHKVARGYQPQPTYSAHWIADAGFRDAVARYLEDERDWVSEDIRAVARHTPFRSDLREARAGLPDSAEEPDR